MNDRDEMFRVLYLTVAGTGSLEGNRNDLSRCLQTSSEHLCPNIRSLEEDGYVALKKINQSNYKISVTERGREYFRELFEK